MEEEVTCEYVERRWHEETGKQTNKQTKQY